MEEDPNRQNPSDNTEENQLKKPTPQKANPSEMVVESSADHPEPSISQNKNDQGTNDTTVPPQGPQTNPTAPEHRSPQKETKNAQDDQSRENKGENASGQNVQGQDLANNSNAQAVAQTETQIIVSSAENKTNTRGPRILFYGSCECDQFYAGEDRYIIKRPFEIETPFSQLGKTVYTVVCGSMHTLILLTNGEVYSLGNNDDGALGRKTDSENKTADENRPGKVDLPVPVDMIAAGDSHSIACNSANSMVFQWGVYRNILRGNISKVDAPHQIGEKEFARKNIKKISSGANHTLVLADEKVYVWGDPESGILGRVPTERRMFQQGLNIEALGVRNVENIFTGAYHSFLVQRKKKTKSQRKENEEDTYTVVLAWGLNNFGQLGIGTAESTHIPTEIEEFEGVEIKDIQGGEHHTIVLTGEGELYGFGKNDEGQLGIGDVLAREEEEQKLEEQKKEEAKDEENKEGKDEQKDKMVEEVKQIEKFNKERIQEPKKLSLEKVKKIFSGANFNYAMDEEDKIYSWGMGENHVLGDGEEETVEEPTEIKKRFQGRAILYALGAQHVATLVVDEGAEVKIELDEEVTKVKETNKKAAKKKTTPAKKKEGEKIEEEKKDKKKDKDEEEEEEEEGEDEEEEKEEKKTRGRKKEKEDKKGKSQEKKEDKKSRTRAKTTDKKKTTETKSSKTSKASKEEKEVEPAKTRNTRKRRQEVEDERDDKKKVKKTTSKSKDSESKTRKKVGKSKKR